MLSIISILVACSGGENEAVEAPVTPAATEAAPTEPIVTPACTDSTPDDGVDDCVKQETVAPATESIITEPTIVVVAK